MKKYDPSLPAKFLQKNGAETLKVGPLQKIYIPETRSEIIKKNDHTLWCSVFYGLKDLFRKDVDITFAYGRRVCDTVKAEFNCYGFFTSDELPRYGITRADKRAIYQQLGEDLKSKNLVTIYAYPEEIATKIRTFLIGYFTNEIENYKPEIV
jgi:Glu-tRNA(Gln) amidotransferase subunit E-like FAD-binding protein